MRRRTVMAAMLFLLSISAFNGASAQPGWIAGWIYRCPVTITNTCGTQLEDYQVRVVLDPAFYFGHAKEGGLDLRLTDADGVTTLQFSLDIWKRPEENAVMWVKLPVFMPGDTTLYLYYGNEYAHSASDGGATFVLYDGFEEYDTGSAPGGSLTNPGEWTRYAGNPLITEGSSGEWDDHGATFASVIYDMAESEFRMYYHGFSTSGVHQVGLATSPDGLSWTKYPGNPIFTPGPDAWDGQSVRVPMVWKEDTLYHMIYTGNGSGGMQVGYATSIDGIGWTKHPSNPVFNDPTWAHGETENWGVMKVDSLYLMWYSDFGMRQSGIAVSEDLVDWTPHTAAPIFASSGDPGDDRYSQYCPFSFSYGDDYYVLVPSYDGGANYSSYYLYRSSSPYFPEADRHLVRIAHTTTATGEWDDHDSDTPFVLTYNIERSHFHNNELWCYYASEGGANLWKEGLHIETDIAAALADAPLPDGGFSWSGGGEVTIVDAPVRHGDRGVRQNDTSASASSELNAYFSSRTEGRLGAWMRRASTTNGDYDIYLYGGGSLACVAGLGRDGDFHYWNGSFQPTAVSWAIDEWYYIQLSFDAPTGDYDFMVYDTTGVKIVDVAGIAFGNPASSIDRAMFYTSSGYTGEVHMDEFRIMDWCGQAQTALVGDEEEFGATPVSGTPPPVFELHQNHPNPFNPVTTIRYELPIRSDVTLGIYDVSGRWVLTLVDAPQEPGNKLIVWDGRDGRGRLAASGIYFYRLRAGEFELTRKMVLLR